MKNTALKLNKTLSILLLSVPTLLFGKGNAPDTPILDWMYENVLFILAILVIAGVLMLLFGLIDTVFIFQRNQILEEQGISLEKTRTEKGPGFWEKLYQKAWALVPIEKEDDIDLGHEYDGIRELDNSLPPWWLYLFYITIIWSGVYLYVYHFSDLGMSQEEEYEYAMEQAADEKRRFLASQGVQITENNVTLITDAATLDGVKEVYIANCVVCHGAEGQGGVGPNLTDPYWVHGGGISDVFKTIKYGVPEKGMIAWESQLRPKTMQALASYILSLQGSNPPNPKAAEGELYNPEPVAENQTQSTEE